LKRFSKRICKNKTSGASVVQNVKIKESKPCISNKSINWFNSKQPMHLPYAN
jgi:ArsR family metal-binding transcriptional regulator